MGAFDQPRGHVQIAAEIRDGIAPLLERLEEQQQADRAKRNQREQVMRPASRHAMCKTPKSIKVILRNNQRA
jgi:hypothetical protein